MGLIQSLPLCWFWRSRSAFLRSAPDSPKAPKPAAATGASERRLLTGSYIPQQFRQDGRITTGPNKVQVLSAKSIQLTGAATLSRALGALGANR